MAIVGQLRADGHEIDEETLSHVTPLLRKYISTFNVCRQLNGVKV
jgi:hypothetical protein